MDPNAPKREGSRKPRSKAASAGIARDLVRRCEWMDLVPVVWTGEGGDEGVGRMVGERLRGRASGVYVIEVGYRAGVVEDGFRAEEAEKLSGPEIPRVVHVSLELIGQTSRALVRLERFPKLLPKLVGDGEKWLRERQELLVAYAAAVRGGPLELPHVVALMPEDDLPGLAANEFLAWSGAVPSAGVKQALEAIADRLRDACGELGRRWDKVRAAVGAGARSLPEFENEGRAQAPESGSVARKRYEGLWKNVAQLLALEFPQVAAVIDDEKLTDSLKLQRMFEVLLGFHLPKAVLHDVRNLRAGTLVDYERGCAEIFGALSAEGDRVECIRLARRLLLTAARIAAFGHGDTSLRALGQWVDTCRRRVAPGPGGHGALKAALETIETGLTWSAMKRENVLTLAQGLGECAESLMRYATLEQFVVIAPGHDKARVFLCGNVIRHLCGNSDPMMYGKRWASHRSPVAVLGRLGNMDLELVRVAIERRLFHLVSSLLHKHADAVTPFLARVAKRDSGWFDIGLWEKTEWTSLYRKAPLAEATFLDDWVDQVREAHELSWADVSELVDSVATFCDDEESGSTDGSERARFLVEKSCVMERVLASALRTSEFVRDAELDDDEGTGWYFYQRREVLELALAWERSGFPGGNTMVDLVLAASEAGTHRIMQGNGVGKRLLEWSARTLRLAVALCAGRADVLVMLLDGNLSQSAYPTTAEDGWAIVEQHLGLKALVEELAARSDRVPRMLRLLQRLALVRRLCGEAVIGRLARTWEEPADVEPPDGLAQSGPHVREIALLAWYRGIAGFADRLPKEISDTLEREHWMRKQVRSLQSLDATGGLHKGGAVRLAKLKAALRDPQSVRRRVEKDLKRRLPAALGKARVAALETLLSQALDEHWRLVLGADIERAEEPAWDNALFMYCTVESNKRVLKQLLRHCAAHTGEAFRHPTNEAFLRRLEKAGLDTGAWCNGGEWDWTVAGNNFRVYVEKDPLEVMQMGNYFGTCLSKEGFNNFAAVANAVEVNKHVIYVADEGDNVVGRKLVGLTPDGQLVGFRNYGGLRRVSGAFADSWLHIMLDQTCLRLARACGARLPDLGEGSEYDDRLEAGDNLRLFANWYNDGPARYDWWVLEMQRQELPDCPEEAAPALLVAVQTHMEGTERSAAALRRLILWLGPHGQPLLDDERVMEFLESHVATSDLRRAVSRSGRQGVEEGVTT